ncbi:MAG: hypothetical protein AAF533_00105 [Acidobacteriota bacterium]
MSDELGRALEGEPAEGETPRRWTTCRCGCLAALVVTVVVAAFVYVQWIHPMVRAAREMDASLDRYQEARRQLWQVDVDLPSPWQGDLAEVDVPADLLDRYVALRQELGPPMAKAEVAAKSPKRPLGSGLLGGFGHTMQEIGATPQKARLAEKTVRALQQRQVTPARFDQMLQLVEHRFLDSHLATTGGLTPVERHELLLARANLRFAQKIHHLDKFLDETTDGDDVAHESKADVNELRAQITELSRRGQDADRTLSPATLALFESRREELEALPTLGLAHLFELAAWPWLPGDQETDESDQELTAWEALNPR